METREKLAIDTPLYDCVVCQSHPAEHCPSACMCLAYCEQCVPAVCRVCGLTELSK